MGKNAKKLWEVDHPYYCNLGNYFNNDCGNSYDSWKEFIDGEGDADPDYNLVFRWDWHATEEDSHLWPKQELCIFWMGQRKGLYRFTQIAVDPEEEPAIRKWLTERYAYLKQLWEPLE